MAKTVKIKKASLTQFENDGTCSLKEICETNYDLLEWLVPGIIPLEGVTMLVGSPKSGKSFLILNIIISYLVSDIILNFFPTPEREIKILYLDLEASKRRIKERAVKIVGERPFPTNLIVANYWPRFGEGGLSKLRTRIELEHFDLIIIDILGKVQSIRKISNIHSYSLDQQEIDKFSSLCKQFNTSIILVHHTRKSKSPDWVDMISGTHGISGTVDTLLYLYREKNQTQAILHVTGRDIDEESYKLDFDKKTKYWEILGTVDGLRGSVSKARTDILRILGSTDGIMSPTEIADRLHKSPSSVKAMLANMLIDRQIVKIDYGKYAKRILPQ